MRSWTQLVTAVPGENSDPEMRIPSVRESQ
jgi:hypothetical protein